MDQKASRRLARSLTFNEAPKKELPPPSPVIVGGTSKINPMKLDFLEIVPMLEVFNGIDVLENKTKIYKFL